MFVVVVVVVLVAVVNVAESLTTEMSIIPSFITTDKRQRVIRNHKLNTFVFLSTIIDH